MGQDVLQTVQQGLHFLREEQFRQRRFDPLPGLQLLAHAPQVTQEMLGHSAHR